ncbi:thada protein [Malassezia pachydermatis]|uniref:Thada protein n=1 Tax=Malassezia pachydermatis TaxID=77020 RepID=A0A0M8MWF1_9BASI|nr:thada protein [Malassezia pachydermatis]KOS15664.1 thada protein [Malassezia pachydermatis]
MSTRAAEALQEVQAAIAAWTEEPPVPASDILDVLASALDMLQSPHPWDGARRGSTLASGVDALRAWCQHAPPHIARLSDKRAFCTHPVWEICTTRIEGVFALPPSSALQRVRTLLDQLWTMWDQVDEVTAPSSWAKAWYQAHASLNQGVSLLVMDALLTHYGLAILEETPRCFFQRILADIQAGRGQVSRRSHLASTLIAATQHTDAWLTAWLPVLASSLSHTDERAADNVMAHVVHPLLDQWPSTLAPLLDALDERGDSYAIVAVLQAAKVRDLCTLDENAASNSLIVPLSLLEACLSSGSPRMHVAALALCVDAKTPAQPLHAHEIHIVRRFFAESLMMPSSVARKDSIAFFVKLLVRIRTSANKLSKDDARLRAMHGLLQHLYDAVVFAMHPGAPYPCMILATSLLLLLLEATSPISTVPMHMHRLHDAMRALHKAQKTFPAAALPPLIPTQPVILRLVHLATESTYDDIQGTAVLILMRLAQRPSSLLRDVSFLTDHVVLPSWTRLPAMKESDAYASVQLLQLYHKVCPEAHHKDVLSSLGVSHDASLSWTQNLIEVHTKRLTAYLTTTTSLAHASTHGLHGFLAALTYLVACEPPTVPQHLYNVILRVWAFVAPVLRAASDEGAEDVSELERASAATEHTSVSEMQQILSFSWRAIKEASALLCALALHCDPALLPWDDINETFLAWLLQIRHRGAFSTVYPHYQTMARARLVMSSSQPTDWLHALVSRVEAHADAFSTTRRSAGLGYAVMSLLSAHSGATLTQETKWVMQRFLALSHDAVPVRCIHALNIIRVLIMDSSMASAMKMYQADALTRAVACFSSPHWGVRNAAMMLYAAVSNRYFGIHAFQSLNGPTLDGLLDASPALAETLITALCEGSCHVAVSDLATVGHGSGLYAILLLLSQCRGHVSFQREDVLEALARCMASANTSVRTAAAHCYAALVPAEERSRVLAHRVEQSTTRDQNALAGTLALAHACAQLSVPCANVLQANWVWLTDNPCPVTVTGFLEALEACEAGAQASTWLHAFFQASCVPTSTMTLPRDPLVVWLLPVALRLAFAHKVALPMEAWSCSMDMATALIMFSIQEPEPVQAWSRVGWTDEGVRSTLLSILLDSAYPLDARIGAATLLDRMGGEYAAHIQAILTLAYATEHVPLREALLPLLGRAWDSDTLEACVYLWDACAKPDVPTASRLGVAQALSRVHTPTVSMALLTWRLLQDDDADVRAAACALFPPPHISSSRFSCVYAMHRGPQSCIDRLWATWADHPTFHQAVWDLWMPTTSVETKGVSKLFSGEAMNQFQDPVLDLLRAYDACANGRIPCPPHMTSLLTPETAGITEVPTSAEAYHAALQRVLLQQLAQRYASTTSSAWSDASIDKALALLGVPAWSIPKEPASQEASKPLRIA